MTRILVLTSIYPGDDVPKGFTPVVHYFTKEWVKMGCEVLVVNYVANFPKILYAVSRVLGPAISSRVGFPVRSSSLNDKEYSIDGVSVKRIAMKKTRPHRPFSKNQIDSSEQKTTEYLHSKGFVPDIIVSHWFNPQLELMLRLKDRFKGVHTCYVCHSANPAPYYQDDFVRKLFDGCDLIGYRSEHIQRVMTARYNLEKPSFLCYSGIPEDYIGACPDRGFQEVHRYLFVGNLIRRKYPSQILDALVKSYGDDDFEMRYVGSGGELSSIQNRIRDYGINEKVQCLGRVERAEVIRQMEDADVFVMISRGETFGLVYLEAMARGCITIASKDEGFDGIIRDGVNGFLCEAGNAAELSGIISRIRSMTPEDRKSISQKAYETACEMTDVKMARYYLDQLVNL